MNLYKDSVWKNELQVRDPVMKHLKIPPSWWWELTKFGNPGQPSDLSSFAGQHPIPNVAPSQDLAPKAVVHYQVNAGTRPQAGGEFATWIEFHPSTSHDTSSHPTDQSFFCQMLRAAPTPQKKKRNLDSLDARNGAKWDSKAGWKIITNLRGLSCSGPDSTGNRSRSYNATVRKWWPSG